MKITVSQKQGLVPITILHLNGALDGTTYQTLIEKAKQVYQEGARDLLLDFNGLSYISSAGILALHKTALLFRGVTLADEEEGWESVRAVDRDRSSGVQQHVKLLNPQPGVLHVLEVVGFMAFFEIYTDLEKAVASF